MSAESIYQQIIGKLTIKLTDSPLFDEERAGSIAKLLMTEGIKKDDIITLLSQEKM